MRERVVRLSDPVALRAYAHPVRMKLVSLLRREGPHTATQAAAQIGESVPTCSFHLRQLAKYGLVERVPGADARERPWRATALFTSWVSDTDNPEHQAAVDHLEAVIFGRYTERVQEFLRRRQLEPRAWKRVTGPSDYFVYVTPAELKRLQEQFDAMLEQYRPRLADPSLRPAGARGVEFIQFVTTMEKP
jgi:DNA-binding transcriptional ArsR family regulator